MSHKALPKPVIDPGFPLTGYEPCLTGDPDRFHPEGNDQEQQRATKECDGCPTTAACLAWALRVGEVGIWGGTTTAQRGRMRQEPDYVAEPTAARRNYVPRSETYRKQATR